MRPVDRFALLGIAGLFGLLVLIALPDWCRALWGWVQKAKRWL